MNLSLMLRRAPFALASALGLAACAGMPVTPGARALSRPWIEPAETAGLSLRDAGVTALDDDMHAFLASHVDARDASTKLRQLLVAVVENPSFRIDYGDATRSAADTFHVLRGNCLSFTNLFVALARETGLDVSYQEVDVPPTWTRRDEMFVVSRHVNAVVTVNPASRHVVDFNMAEFRAAYPRRAISDERAAAHYYSNLGVERMQTEDAEAALASFQRALAMDPTLSQVWINLGAWYRRQGDAVRAEASYLEALRLSPQELVAMSNLASLHRSAGRPELADWYQRRAARHRQQNPYYRYQLAQTAYLAGDFTTALRHLREALRRNDIDPTFYSLLGMSYRELGRREQAREAFRRAVELADSEELRSAVRHKLELLGAPSAGL